uniref:Uncharacterized protein n=1 Tax=Arundo donax TaxID=35708 RepID=A0A0A8ZM94_ARUDO
MARRTSLRSFHPTQESGTPWMTSRARETARRRRTAKARSIMTTRTEAIEKSRP